MGFFKYCSFANIRNILIRLITFEKYFLIGNIGLVLKRSCLSVINKLNFLIRRQNYFKIIIILVFFFPGRSVDEVFNI